MVEEEGGGGAGVTLGLPRAEQGKECRRALQYDGPEQEAKQRRQPSSRARARRRITLFDTLTVERHGAHCALSVVAARHAPWRTTVCVVLRHFHVNYEAAPALTAAPHQVGGHEGPRISQPRAQLT